MHSIEFLIAQHAALALEVAALRAEVREMRGQQDRVVTAAQSFARSAAALLRALDADVVDLEHEGAADVVEVGVALDGAPDGLRVLH